MSIKITLGTTRPISTNTESGKSKDPNRAVLTADDQLRNLLAKAEVAFANATFASTKSLTRFNKILEKVTNQLDLRENIRRRTPTASNLRLDPELRQRYNTLSTQGVLARLAIKAQQDQEYRDRLRDQYARRAEQERDRREKNVIKRRAELAALQARWIRQDQQNFSVQNQRQNFKLGKGGRIQSMGLTSMPPLGVPSPNYGVPALRGGGFILGGGASSAALSRADSRRFILRGGPYNPDAPYQYPGAGMGGHGGLPIPMGGYAQRRGVPVIAQYRNLPSAREYAGVPQRPEQPVGEYIGQHIFPRRIPQPFERGEIKGGGIAWGKMAAELLGGPAAAIIGVLEAGKELFTIGGTLANQMKPTLGPYNALFRASQMTGGTVGGLQNLFSAGRGGLGVSDTLARWGYTSAEDAASAYAAYGGTYRPMATFAAATQLGQGPNTMFMSNEDWNRQLGKFTGLGMGLSGGGSVEQTKKILTDAFAAGAEKGMPSPEMWDSMNKVLNAMLGTGMAFNPNTLKSVMDMTTFGVGSTVPGMRTGSYQAQAIQAWSEASKNPMGGTGLYATTLLSEAKRLEGTTDLSSKQWQDLITKEGSGYIMDPETAKDIDAMRASGKFRGAFGMLTAEKVLANRGLPPDVMESMYYNSAARQLGLTGRAAAAFSTAFGAPAGAEGYEFNRGPLGTSRTSAAAPFTVMSAHGRRTPFTAGGRRDSFGLGPPPAGVAPGTSAGEARVVDASATAAKLAGANLELDTLGKTTKALNTAFTNLFNKIDKWVGGAPSGKPGGPSA